MNERSQQLGEQAQGGSPLLERERELADLDALALATLAGHGSTVVIEGQPGLGKSRLLDQAAARAAYPQSALILRFTCGELEQELAWSAVRGLLGDGVELPDPADPLSADVDGFAVIHALFRLVAELTRERPLLLLLDDGQWSDRESLRFLIYLQRRLAELPVSLVVAMRPQAADEQSDLLDRITSGPGARLHRLSALSFESVTALVRGGPFPAASDGFCRACWEVTAGNPFYLHELLLGLREERVDPGASAEQLLQILPGSVSRSVLVRLARLPVDGAMAFSGAVAVLGDGTALRHAARLSGIAVDRAAEVADALAASELLAHGEPLRFVHPLVRAAIYADLPAARRAGLHAAAAALLRTEGAGAEVVATHLLHVPLGASPETVVGLSAAAVAARKHGAPHAAIRYLRRALLEPSAERDRGELLVELAHAEAAVGDPLAVEHLREALEGVAPSRRGEILLALGWAEHHAGRFGAAADAFERGLEEATDQSELAAELEAGYLGSATLDSARAADAAARIKLIETAPPERQSPAQRSLLAQVLFAQTTSGGPHLETIELARRIWAGGRLLEQEGADSQTVWYVIGSLSWADAYAEAIRLTDAVLRAADARGSVLAHARGRYARAWPHYWTGRLSEAAADARAAIDIWYGGLETYLPAAIYWLVLVELERGGLEAAERAFALAQPVARWEGTGMAVFVAAVEGHLAAHRGQAARALNRHLRCGELAEELQIRSPSVMPWRSQAALVAALTGERELARELIRDELDLARAAGAPRAIGVALRVAGLVAEEPEATGLLTESVAVLEASGATLEHARACVDLGAAIRRGGKRRAARPALVQGLELALEAGASALAARANTELRAAGGRSRLAVSDGPAGLTASERRIAELAADGHTNRYIAGLLQVSVKAVEWHLHQCYRKLDIKTRRQLAGVLDEA